MNAASYGELVAGALDAAGRGAAGLVATPRAEGAGELLEAYADVLRAVTEHVEFIYGSDLNHQPSQWTSDTHVAVATGLWLAELRAMTAPLDRRGDNEYDPAGAVRHWRRAAQCIRASQELLATHIGRLDRWRSPEAWVLDEPDSQRAALARMAEISSVMTLAGPVLVDRCATHVPEQAVGVTAAIRDHHGPARLLSLGLGDLRRGDADGTQSIEQLRSASAFDVTSTDPMRRAHEQLRSLRSQLFRLEPRAYVGAGVTKDAVTALAGAHGHLAVIMQACAGADQAAEVDLEATAGQSLQASQQWARLRTEWNAVESPAPGEPGVNETAQAILRDFAEITRGPDGWKDPTDIRGRGARTMAVRVGAQRSVESLHGIASSLRVIAARQANSGQLLADARALPREFVSDDLTVVRARLDGKVVQVPTRMAMHIAAQVAVAAESSRELADEVRRSWGVGGPVRDMPKQSERRGQVARYPTVRPDDAPGRPRDTLTGRGLH